MRLRLLLTLSLPLIMSFPLPAAEPSLDASRQCILVLAEDWTSSSGTLRLLERAAPAQPWNVARGPFPVLLGRHGLAPGGAVPHAPAGLHKHEGDGRSPAGVFALGTAFAFAPHTTRMPFLLVKPDTVAVDDARSRYYTQIVEISAVPQPDWRSAERMRAIPHYRLGIAVEYNTTARVADAGSCIFIHCFATPRKTTSGCTAMPEAELEALLKWLDPDAHPRLVQLPLAAYEDLRAAWRLPAFTAAE
jgi:L,D-peptidoglycan transpeptidase YkuD (ErfK/YbiS/YcfS/YnhG family)